MPLPWQMGVLAYVCGILAWSYGLSAGLVLGLACLAFARGRGLAFVALGLAAGLAVGMPVPDAAGVQAWSGQVQIQGVVEEVRTHPGQRISIIAGDVQATGSSLPGRLLWSWENPPVTPLPGQRFETKVSLRELRSRANFGVSSSEAYWKRRGVHFRAYSRGSVPVVWGPKVASVRTSLLERVDSLLPGTQGGATVRALLFGDRFLLETGFMDRVRRAGLSHSLALSGLHLALVAGLGFGAAWLAGRFFPGLLLLLPRQKLGVVLALPLVLVYLWLGGFSMSLLRAALMLVVAGFQLLTGSRSHSQDCLFTAVAMLALFDPEAVHDLSLQLSVLAVAGLVLFMPAAYGLLAPLRERRNVWRGVHAVLSLALVTCSANLFILPAQVLYFSEVTGHLWLNLLWLPVLSFAVLPLSFLGLAAAPCCPLVAKGIFYLAAAGVDLLEQVLLLLDAKGWLGVVAVLRPCGMQVVGYGTVLVAGRALLTARGPHGRALIFLGLGLALMTAPSIWSEMRPWRDEIEMMVLDTGMSQAVSVRGRTGASVLIDGGGGWSAGYDPGRAVVGPALAWNNPPRVDGVLLSHVHADHLRGLFYVLEAFDVGWFGWSGLVDQSQDCHRLVASLDLGQWPVKRLRAGDRLSVEPGLWLEALHPAVHEAGASDNDTSLVLRLVRDGRGLALIPGDVEKRGLQSFLRAGVPLDAEVLVLPHHGSKSSAEPLFYSRVGAKWAVAACGPNNRFGFPHEAVVQACERAGAQVLSTAEHGAVRFRWQGRGAALVTSARFGGLTGD
jgi:competence protein ComEC